MHRLSSFVAILLVLAGCTQTPTLPASPPSPAPARALATFSNASPGFTLLPPTTNPTEGYEILGSGPLQPQPGATDTQSIADENNDVTFNFVNADINAVAQTIFGQVLKENYTIDGGVQGTITLQTTHPLTRAQVLPALETSLQATNLALIHEADGYHIVPLANAPQAGAGNISVAGGPQTQGYGSEIIPLKYANATSIQALIQPLIQGGVQVQVDAARNLLIVSGTSQQRAAIAANVAVFDVNWLAGMSYALVPLQNAAASAVSQEVQQIITGGNSPISGLVRLVVIGQLNAILIVSPQRQYLPEIRNWITRLDQQQPANERQVFVYRVQNGQAKDLASLLNGLLGQPSASNGSQQQTTAPDQQSNDTAQTGSNTSAQESLTGLTPPSGAPAASSSNPGPTGDPSNGGTSDSNQSPRITADNTNNALLIYATPAQYRTLEAALVQLDVPPQQVMLEAVVAEVTLTNSLNYGVQYFFKSGRVQSINTLGSTAGALSEPLPGFAAVLSPGQNIQIMLNALSSLTHVNVISAPRLLVLNNQPAMLQVGDEVPITTQTAQSTETASAPLVSTIQYQNTGVILHVTPRINAGGLVTLDMTQEVSEVSTTTSSTLNSPTISERKISTIVAVQDGQTVALGGLIQSNATTDNSGIPLLNRIPLLGTLFSNKDNSGSRTELLVMITPHVVQSEDSLQAVTNQLRTELGDVQTQ